MKRVLPAVVFIALIAIASARSHRVVIQVNLNGNSNYETIMGNVEALYRAIGKDGLKVEVVCHGPGMDMLLSDEKELNRRILKAEKVGVKFAACANTMKGRKLKLSDLIPGAFVVPSGVAEIVLREEEGYSYLKCGY